MQQAQHVCSTFQKFVTGYYYSGDLLKAQGMSENETKVFGVFCLKIVKYLCLFTFLFVFLFNGNDHTYFS